MQQQDTGEVPQAAFTPRQWDVWELAVQGLEAAEIARQLYLSERVVNWHLLQIYRRHGAGDSHARLQVINSLYDLVPKPGVVLIAPPRLAKRPAEPQTPVSRKRGYCPRGHRTHRGGPTCEVCDAELRMAMADLADGV